MLKGESMSPSTLGSVELWSRSAEDSSAEHRFAGTGHETFENGPFSGFMDMRALREGLYVYRIQGHARHAYRLASGQPAVEGTLILGCMLDGVGTFGARGGMSQTWRESGALYVVDPTTDHVLYDLQPDRAWQLVAVRIEIEALAQGTDRAATEVLAAVRAGQDRAFAHSLPLDRPLRASAQALMTPIYSGRMAMLHAEARTLELLALQLDRLAGRADWVSLTAGERIRLGQARDALLADLREPPSLTALAGVARMSERRLNFGFRLLFGSTAFELLRDARLDLARTLLAEVPDVPLKQVAFRIGYADASNFVKAYRRRFGVTPGLDRRLRAD